MVLVGIMVMLHVVAGLTLMHLFEPARAAFSRFSYVALTVAYLVLITAIIGVVLGKPHIDLQPVRPESIRARRAASVFRRNQNADTA